ncbi:hypothetical protein [Nocardioides sp. Kera G14]|uniref:hypothetical protein n=1 Tax=Nocardioides sp. Kera G14 TaxID=2884264 RepID=UPI001D10E04A|nr:hypothetical protein [Nocardioides sp. Kera G14]UDY24599.1 hypothetical protein LH076_04645 [Nocardioides sp. Kera G14]
MSSMRRRILLLAIALVATVLAPFTGLSAASAASYSCTTVATLKAGATSTYIGYEVPAAPGLTTSCPDLWSGGPSDGTVSLQRRLAGTTAWQTIWSEDLAGSSNAAEPNVAGTAQYKLVYSGGTYTSGSDSVTFSPSTSAVITIAAKRLVTVNSKKVRGNKPIPVTWTAAPAAQGIVYLKKKGKKKWKVAKRVTVSPSGVRFKLRAPVGTKVRFYIPATTTILAFDWTTKIKRTAF